MKQPILVGVALAVLIAAAGVFAPAMTSAKRKASLEAHEQTALALRELARVSMVLPRLSALVAESGIAEADLDPVVESARDTLEDIRSRYAQAMQAAERQAAAHGLEFEGSQPVAVSVQGVRQALGGFESSMKENAALLRAALKDARDAASRDDSAVGVAQVLGMAEYAQASMLLAEAQVLRGEQAEAQGLLLQVGSDWKNAQGLLDQFAGYDMAPVLAGLRDDLTEVSAGRSPVVELVRVLSEQVEEREASLEEAGRELEETTAELRQLEDQGFVAGDDGSFMAYRRNYMGLSERVRWLQAHEQELRYGGVRGAEMIGDDFRTAEIRGGEELLGVDALREQLSLSEELLQRWNGANTSLEDHAEFVTESGERVQAEVTRYQERQAALEQRQTEVAARIETLNRSAFEKEDEALRAAEKSVQAFQKSRRAIDAWVSAARTAQRELDPKRLNERLKLILADPYIEQLPRSSEASARMLAGRIHAQRVEYAKALMDDMGVLEEVNPAFEFDEGVFIEQIETALSAGMETVESARATFQDMAEKLDGEPTKWVPIAAQAAAHHLLARLDSVGAAEHMSLALDLIGQTVDLAGDKLPYAQAYVAFRDHLSGVSSEVGAPDAVEEDGTGAPSEETDDESFFEEDTTEGGDDIFGD